MIHVLCTHMILVHTYIIHVKHTCRCHVSLSFIINVSCMWTACSIVISLCLCVVGTFPLWHTTHIALHCSCIHYNVQWYMCEADNDTTTEVVEWYTGTACCPTSFYSNSTYNFRHGLFAIISLFLVLLHVICCHWIYLVGYYLILMLLIIIIILIITTV